MDNENKIIQQLKGINTKLKILLWFLLVTFIISTAVIPLSMELLSKVVFELKIKRQSGFQESPRFHQRIVHLQSPLPGNQSHVTFSNSFLHIVPA